jgi:muramoyltetrapeptide carboxypeptidase
VTPPRTRAGLIKFRPVRPGSRIALVAPASPFDRDAFDRGLQELTRLGFEPVFDESVFDREPIVAGSAARRAEAFARAMTRDGVDAVMAVRGGYGSIEILPLLDAEFVCRRRTAFVGYSDLTSLHAFLQTHGPMTSVHGAMLEGRLASGTSTYDVASLLGSLSAVPLGELTPPGVEVLRAGEASGPLFGGTLKQIAAGLGTPYALRCPPGAVLFLEDVAERPYSLRRALVQLQLAGLLAHVSGLVFGQMPRCDEPDGRVTARGVIADFVADFSGPVLFGFPSGHATTPLVSLPFGTETRVVAGPTPRLVVEEAAAA